MEFDVENVHGGQLQVGDEVLMRATVTELHSAGSKDSHHVYLKCSDRLFNMGDRYIWTWGWEMADESLEILRLKKKPEVKTIPMRLTEAEAHVIKAIREGQQNEDQPSN